MSSLTIKPSELQSALSVMIPAKDQLLIVGPPGVGKTDIVHAACKATDHQLIVSHPVTSDPVDYKGMPFPNIEQGFADFLPFGDLRKLMTADSPTVFFLDDIGQAAPSVQAALMQLLDRRELNGKRISDHVTFLGATNRRTDRAAVNGILETVKSRFTTIVNLRVDLDDWVSWAMNNDINPAIIGFVRFKPGMLHDFAPTADMSNSPCPRTWSKVNNILKRNLPVNIEHVMVAGAVGEGAATEFRAFMKVYRELPDLDLIIKDPVKAPLPKDLSVVFAIAAGLAMKTTTKNFESIAIYAQRLDAASKGDVAVFMVRDGMRKEPKIAQTPAFAKLAETKFGDMILGRI